MSTELGFHRFVRLSQRMSVLRAATVVLATSFVLVSLGLAQSPDQGSDITLEQAQKIVIGKWKLNLHESEKRYGKFDPAVANAVGTMEFEFTTDVFTTVDVSRAYRMEKAERSSNIPSENVAGKYFEVISQVDGQDNNEHIRIFDENQLIFYLGEDMPSAVLHRIGSAAMRNPGFEEPRVEEGRFTFVETMPGWKTTDTHFEIWSTGFEEVAAHEGTQFVELNAYIDGTLYQDSTGIQPGSVLEFTFAHRGRNGDDTMKLTITDLGADNALDGEDDTVLFTNEYTTGKDAWVVYDSTTEQKIKALGNTVRFAYSAVSGTGGRGPDKTEGNFLDAANFGVGVVSEAPPENAMKLDVDGGAFAFGYRTTVEPGFTEFPNTDSPHPGITRRNRADGEYFSFAQNTRETELKAQESDLVFYPAKAEGSGVLHPGKNPGDVAIARFTAMNDGEYHFKITAQLIEENPTGAGVTIYVDGQAVAETQLNEQLAPWTTSPLVKLKKGQTVDIAVDSGVGENWEKDHVLLTAKAWTTSPAD